jgi:hypothetical protein
MTLQERYPKEWARIERDAEEKQRASGVPFTFDAAFIKGGSLVVAYSVPHGIGRSQIYLRTPIDGERKRTWWNPRGAA